jgi:hypothetical protein
MTYLQRRLGHLFLFKLDETEPLRATIVELGQGYVLHSAPLGKNGLDGVNRRRPREALLREKESTEEHDGLKICH